MDREELYDQFRERLATDPIYAAKHAARNKTQPVEPELTLTPEQCELIIECFGSMQDDQPSNYDKNDEPF
ncbi:MAG TPA: hypothetical protein VM715_09500 [Candidatus Acidoferrum sp.]|nr:hypothetical protein [Candidatus Acidoferrum sp.]